MKSKVLLPIFAASVMLCSFTACSDSDSPAPAAPVVSDPTAVDPTATNPATTDPVVTDPATTDPTVTDPTVTDPAVTNPVVTDTSVSNPTVTDTAVVDPGVTTPVVTPVVTGGAPATPSTDANGYVVTWTRSNDGIDTVASNVSVPVDDFDSYTYYGAELSGVDQFQYGRFEARMKMVSIPGSVSSMFLYYDNSWKKGDEPWNEIDIEVLGKNKGMWQSNLITRISDDVSGKVTKSNTTSEFKHRFGFDATADFHTYAMIWTPEYISWEIDSVEIRRDYLGEKKGQVEFMTKEQTLRFNLWSAKSTSWVGKFTGAELADGPQTQYIDYVRVYKYDEATKSFTLDWQDDFEGSSLSDHWTAGNWEMENVTLNPDNVVVEDGMCKLLMTREAK